MEPLSDRIDRWIADGRDARSAHWQGGLERMLELFSPVLQAGKLVPVLDLADDDLAVFTPALASVDLSPGLWAAFLPPPVAGKIMPPAAADTLARIDEGKPSYKILIARPGRPQRVMCAEISTHARRPGVDIFQSGALLGSYDYQNQEECLTGLTQTVRVHLWKRDGWCSQDYRQYTIHWFEKVLAIENTAAVDENFSFLHSPTLIRSNRIDAMFTLIGEIVHRRFTDADDPDSELAASIQNIADAAVRADRLDGLVQDRVLALLQVMRQREIVSFEDFSDTEADQFKQAFPAAVRRMAERIVTADRKP